MPDYTPTAEQAIAMKWGLIRDNRNALLAETDWWGASDLTMSSARTTYRQTLRDIPATYSSNPDSVEWPSKPS